VDEVVETGGDGLWREAADGDEQRAHRAEDGEAGE